MRHLLNSILMRSAAYRRHVTAQAARRRKAYFRAVLREVQSVLEEVQ